MVNRRRITEIAINVLIAICALGPILAICLFGGD